MIDGGREIQGPGSPPAGGPAAATAILGLGLAAPSARHFAIRFVAIAALLLGAYYFPYPAAGFVNRCLDGYLRGYTWVSGAVIRVFDPGVQVTGMQIGGRYSLRLIKTCDAMDVKTLFVAAVIAWPAGWRRRAVAALGGFALLFVLNVARISSLYFVGVHFPSSFELIHLELWPIVLLAAALGMFMAATRWMSGPSLLPASPLPAAHDDGPA